MRRSFALGTFLVGTLVTTSAQQPPSPTPHIRIVAKGTPRVLSRLPSAVQALTQPGPAGAQLLYYGGPVISNVKVVVVFWGSKVNTTVTGGTGGFFAAVTNSAYYDVASEYSTKGITPVVPASSTNQTLGRGTLDSVHTITPSICNTNSCTIFDNQIQAELQRQINAGHLPAISVDGQGIPNTLYMIYFPPGVSINDGTPSNPGSNSCVTGGFCGYHGTGTLNSKELLYGVLPDFSPGSGCDVGCGGSTMFNNITMVSSHELMEAATDPGVGLAANYAPPLGWYDQTNGEVGDICNQFQVNSPNVPGYSVQLVWSNVQNACADGPPQFRLSAPASAKASIPFTVTVTAEDTSGNVLSNYQGKVHFTSTDPAAILPPDGSGSTFQVTLNTLGSQTISVQDTHTLAMIGSAPTSVTSGMARNKARIQVITQ